MSPWTILGWLLVALVVLWLGTLVVIGLLARDRKQAFEARKRKRQVRRARKGKVTCGWSKWEREYLPGQDDIPVFKREVERVKVVCSRTATHYTRRPWLEFYCEEHSKNVGIGSGSAYWAKPLIEQPPKPTKVRVIS